MSEVVTGQGRGKRWRARAQQPIARLMFDAIDDSKRGAVPYSSYPGLNRDELEGALFTHKIAPAVYLHLSEAEGVPADVMQLLHDRYSQQMVRQLQVQADLAMLARVLNGAGIAWAAMKGPVLAQRLWSRPDLRQYIDLDILVDRHSFDRVLDVLIDNGATMLDCNWQLVREQVRAEVSLQLPNGTSLDLHWHVVNSAELRKCFTFRTEDMLERAVPMQIGETQVPAIDSVDTLLHLAYHTAHSGGHRLMWLKDVERATADPQLDWDLALRRADECGVRLAMAVVLARVERVLGFEIPPPAAAMSAATRSPWGWFAASVERWSPAPMLPGDKYSGQLAFKNTRRTTASSAVGALRSVRHRGVPMITPSNNPLRIEAGGDAMRTSYLELLKSEPQP